MAGLDNITVGFIGGSITQGAVASKEEYCYASRVFDWIVEETGVDRERATMVNAGIGGTTSQFGAARVGEDILGYDPDLVFVEFSVNDEDDWFFMETYEGLVRQLIAHPKHPKIVLIHNLFYEDGTNAQRIHKAVGEHYGIESVSVRDVIYPMLLDGSLLAEDVAPDKLHPNDAGHSLVASVIIQHLSTMIMEERGIALIPSAVEREPLTVNRYEKVTRWQSYNCKPELKGFTVDSAEKASVRDVFKEGWVAKNPGDSIRFQLEDVSKIAVQYRKSISKPAPIAKATVDGNEVLVIKLDGNFDEDWGDSLHIETLPFDLNPGLHTLDIEIIEGGDGVKSSFYLVSVIGVK